jgi:hypothetical protein
MKWTARKGKEKRKQYQKKFFTVTQNERNKMPQNKAVNFFQFYS